VQHHHAPLSTYNVFKARKGSGDADNDSQIAGVFAEVMLRPTRGGLVSWTRPLPP
jgi:hypothetical protein